MVSYTALIQKFGDKGEKTGWTYIEIPADIAQQIKPHYKKGFRVKGSLDKFAIKGVSLLPMGEGAFIMPINAGMRKGIKKKNGEKVLVKLAEDTDEKKLSEDFMLCLQDEPKAYAFFKSLAGSHQRYYSNWIESAKTEATKAKRIAKAVKGLALQLPYNEMLYLDKEK